MNEIFFEGVKYTRSIKAMEESYFAGRLTLEFGKTNSNAYFGPAHRQHFRNMMLSQVRRLGQFFVQEDAICKKRKTFMYSTGKNDQKGFEHVIPMGSGKKEDTGALCAYLNDQITVDQLLITPVCKVHKKLDKDLKGKHVWLNEDTNHFFRRYLEVGYSGPVKTWRDEIVDLKTWDMKKHIEQVIKPHPVWGYLFNKFSSK